MYPFSRYSSHVDQFLNESSSSMSRLNLYVSAGQVGHLDEKKVDLDGKRTGLGHLLLGYSLETGQAFGHDLFPNPIARNDSHLECLSEFAHVVGVLKGMWCVKRGTRTRVDTSSGSGLAGWSGHA